MGDTWEPYSSDSDSDDNDVYIARDPRKDKHFDRKQELLWNCKGKVGRKNTGRQPQVIAVIGPPGCGKSSFLNTVFAAFSNDHWEEHAKYGDFGNRGKQYTIKFKSFEKKDYYKDQDDYLMPTFLDMIGFEDEDSSVSKELLNIVLSGKLKDGEELSSVIKYAQTYGLNALREKYFGEKYFGVVPVYRSRTVLDEFFDLFALPNRKDNHRVNKVIVVCSANPEHSLPKNLFEAVTDVTNRERDITLYGVLTQCDKYKSKNPKVKQKEIAFRRSLGIPLERFAKVKNYCPEVDKNMTYQETIIPSLDVPVLRLMRQVLTMDVNNEDKSFKERIKTSISRFVPNLSEPIAKILFLLFLAMILFIFYRSVF